MEDFQGPYELVFVGGTGIKRVMLEGAILRYDGQPVYLRGKDGHCYNWSTIISVKKVM